MINYINKKIQRLLISKNIMKLFYFFHFLSGGFYSKKIAISFQGKKNRVEIVKNILKKKNYKSYLEI